MQEQVHAAVNESKWCHF